MGVKKIKTKNYEKRQKLIRIIFVIIVILIFLGLILTAALGNLDSVRTLWKTP